jgi:hypothetical protein
VELNPPGKRGETPGGSNGSLLLTGRPVNGDKSPCPVRGNPTSSFRPLPLTSRGLPTSIDAIRQQVEEWDAVMKCGIIAALVLQSSSAARPPDPLAAYPKQERRLLACERQTTPPIQSAEGAQECQERESQTGSPTSDFSRQVFS